MNGETGWKTEPKRPAGRHTAQAGTAEATELHCDCACARVRREARVKRPKVFMMGEWGLFMYRSCLLTDVGGEGCRGDPVDEVA